jgi:hypothetical protein
MLGAERLNTRGAKAGRFATAEDYAAGMERIAAALGVSENGPSEFKFDIGMIL